MKRLLPIVLMLFMLTACEGIWLVRIDRYEPDITETPVPSSTSLPTGTPANTITPTPSSTPTVAEPTPTRETLNSITTTARASLRSTPEILPDNRIRVTDAGETFTAFEYCNGWLDVGVGWLYYSSSWIDGDISNVPVCAESQSRIGYNTLEVYNRDYHFAHASAICPAYQLYMDDLNLAVDAYERLHDSCGTEIIHRNWHIADSYEYQVRTPQELVNRWIAEGHREIIRYGVNEAGSGSDSWQSYVAWEVELAELAHENGFRVVIGNTGVGKYTAQAVLNGTFNPMVQVCIDTGCLLGFHEYTGIAIPFGFGQMPREALLNPDMMQPANWSTNVQFAFAGFDAQSLDTMTFGDEMMLEELGFMAQMATECGQLPSYWHLGRSFWILLYYECTTGVSTSQLDIVHTEWGWDYLDDIGDTTAPLRASYGISDFNGDLRGWQSLENVWAWYWSEWTPAQAAFYQIDYAIDLYPDNHYFLLFTWTDNCSRDWYRAGFGFGNCSTDGDAQEFHRLLENNLTALQ